MSRSRSFLGAVHPAIFARRHTHTLLECLIGAAPTRPTNPAGGGIDRQVSFTQEVGHLLDPQHRQICQRGLAVGLGEHARELFRG